MQNRILSGITEFKGKKYWPTGGEHMVISPREEDGISINGVLITPKSLRPVTKYGARYLEVVNSDGAKVAEVVEHVLSATFGAGIHNAEIRGPKTMPVIGPGINDIYEALIANSADNSDAWVRGHGDAIEQERLFTSQDGSCSLEVKPAKDLYLEIERQGDPEIGIDTKIVIPDLYKTMLESEDARRARPIARLKNPLIYAGFSGIQLLGGKGLTGDNYILNKPNTTPEEIQKQMLTSYKNDSNEHLMHTAISDFFGELHTYFPFGMRGKFIFTGRNNHITRLELLREVYKSGVWE